MQRSKIMQCNPNVSIIIPVYNGEKYIKQQIITKIIKGVIWNLWFFMFTKIHKAITIKI